MAKNDISELKAEIEWSTNLYKIIHLEYAIGRCPLLWRWIQVNAMNQNYDESAQSPPVWSYFGPLTLRKPIRSIQRPSTRSRPHIKNMTSMRRNRTPKQRIRPPRIQYQTKHMRRLIRLKLLIIARLKILVTADILISSSVFVVAFIHIAYGECFAENGLVRIE